MGISATGLFSRQQKGLAKMAKANEYPERIAVLQHLIKAISCICGDLEDDLGLAQATFSQHLKALKTACLTQGTVEGTNVCNCIR